MVDESAPDIASGRLQTDNPVSVDTERASVSAKSLRVEDSGKVIIFENSVRMTLRPTNQRQVSER